MHYLFWKYLQILKGSIPWESARIKNKSAENCKLLCIATVAMMRQLLWCQYNTRITMSSWPRCSVMQAILSSILPWYIPYLCNYKYLNMTLIIKAKLNAAHSLKTLSMFRGMSFVDLYWFWLKYMQLFNIDLSSIFLVCHL